MPDIVTWDGPNLRIVEIDSDQAVNELDLTEIYSEWKDWVKVGDNAKFPPAFREVGGDPISDTESLGITIFIQNGWKIRPAEDDHKLQVGGNLFTDPAGESAYVTTTGSFTVNVETKVSSLHSIIIANVDDLYIAIQSLIGNADVSVDDLTITIKDTDLTTLREMSVSADGRTRRIL